MCLVVHKSRDDCQSVVLIMSPQLSHLGCGRISEIAPSRDEPSKLGLVPLLADSSLSSWSPLEPCLPDSKVTAEFAGMQLDREDCD